MEIADLRPLVRGVAGFLPQFPLDGGEPVLVRCVQLAGGDLQDHLIQRITVLPLHDHFVILGDRDHADRADVADHFPDGAAAVGEGDDVPLYVKDDAVKDVLRRSSLFRKAGPFGISVEIHRAPVRLRPGVVLKT